MLLSINQISELTGRDRRTILKRLENLPFQPGDKDAHLIRIERGVPGGLGDGQPGCRARGAARSSASLNTVREDVNSVSAPDRERNDR